MKHLTLPRFWRYYERLPKKVQDLADKNFKLLQADPYHPSGQSLRGYRETAKNQRTERLQKFISHIN